MLDGKRDCKCGRCKTTIKAGEPLKYFKERAISMKEARDHVSYSYRMHAMCHATISAYTHAMGRTY